MSELRVDSVKSKGGGAPNLPKGVTISGIATAATLGATQVDVSNVNVSGVVTSGTLSGDLLSTGTPTLGLGVTINSSGLVVSGVATAGIVSATTIFGNGANLSGIGATLAPIFYHPDPSDTGITFGTGIGITFNQQIKAGTGNITIRETSASGTVVENFGVGSSVTISENRVTFSPTNDLSESTVYHVSYPSGCFTNNEGTNYVGTAYTFKALAYDYKLYAWGYGSEGFLAQNNRTSTESPVQVVGTIWSKIRCAGTSRSAILATKNDGTMWSWGYNVDGQTGVNGSNPAVARVSSPTQLPGTTWSSNFCGGKGSLAVKTDGTLWSWGYNQVGGLGQNSRTSYSSPVQVGSDTTWSTSYNKIAASGSNSSFVIKTDGTLWAWGENQSKLGLNNNTHYSSPVQIPGTTWAMVDSNYGSAHAIKTDGTLWSWGSGTWGGLGTNTPHNTSYSSPKQVPGTTWSKVRSVTYGAAALKTDGTLWTWGRGNWGSGAYNLSGPNVHRSSPVQVPGTTWNNIFAGGAYHYIASKTDGTLWAWGNNAQGALGQGNTTQYSSPVQIPGTTWNYGAACSGDASFFIQQVTP